MENNMVGLSRSVKSEWLNKTAELVVNGLSEFEIKDELNKYLALEIQSPTNLRKTREILMNVWVRTIDERVHQSAIMAYRKVGSNKTALSWALLLLAYPVFANVCGLIGKISTVQDTFSNAWLKEKLFATWGERQTLLHSTDKILQTLKSLGAIENTKIGVYKIKTQLVSDELAIKTILLALLSLKAKSYYEITELPSVPQLFPFVYEVSLENLHNDPDFTLNNFGGKLVISSID